MSAKLQFAAAVAAPRFHRPESQADRQTKVCRTRSAILERQSPLARGRFRILLKYQSGNQRASSSLLVTSVPLFASQPLEEKVRPAKSNDQVALQAGSEPRSIYHSGDNRRTRSSTPRRRPQCRQAFQVPKAEVVHPAR